MRTPAQLLGTNASTTGRRQFMRLGIAALLSTGMLCGIENDVFAQQSKLAKQSNQNIPLADKSEIRLTRSKFSTHLSEVFVFRMNGEEVHLQLVKIEDLNETNVSQLQRRKMKNDEAFKAKWHEESFSLTFRTMSEQPLPQGTYQLSHDDFGRVEIFLTPVGKPEGPWRIFEAVFNRLPE